MAKSPEWAKRRNEGGAWFSHDKQENANESLRFRKKTFDGADEFKKWDYLKNPHGGPEWQVEKGGSKWDKKGQIARRRKKEDIRADEDRLRDEVRREKFKERTLEVRRVELAHQDKPHAYKDIISWEEDRLLAKNPKKPLKEARPLLVQNTEGRVERMTKETASEMRSSRNRFYCEPSVDPARQAKLKAGGLMHPRKTAVLGTGQASGHANTIESYGVADALSHAVYGGKALKPEWDLQPATPSEISQPTWYGLEEHVKSEQPAKQPPAPNWWPKGSN